MGFFSDLFSKLGFGGGAEAKPKPAAIDDPQFETSIRQAVSNMRDELSGVVKASAEAISLHNRLESEYRFQERHSADWKAKAKLALESGDEALARKALERKARSDAELESLKPNLDAARDSAAALKERMTDLKRRIEEAERNTTTLIARRNAVRASRKVTRVLAGVNDSNCAFARLEAFEASVVREEAETRAYRSLSIELEASRPTDRTDDDGGGVDTELEKLRRELGRD